MSHLIVLRPTFYCPMGVCVECASKGETAEQRVFCWDEVYDFQVCHACLGIKWSQLPTAEIFADFAQKYQRHDIVKGLLEFQPTEVSPTGKHTPWPRPKNP